MLKLIKRQLLKMLMRNEELYAIATSLRGPDNIMFGTLKRIFTARIRYLIGGDPSYGYSVRFSPEIDICDIAHAIIKVDLMDSHYLTHVAEAIEALEKLGAIERDEANVLWHLAMSLKRISLISRDGYIRDPYEFEAAVNRILSLIYRYPQFFA